MPRFFVEVHNITSDKISITGDDVNHIRKVLRLKEGDSIVVCNGRAIDYDARISGMEKDRITADIISSCTNINEPPLKITLFQGIAKADKMDFIIQKSIELGVLEIVPIVTDRTVIKIDQDKDSVKKAVRWQRIAIEAAKQCNRGIIPQVREPVDYKSAIKLASGNDLAVIPYERETARSLKSEIHCKYAKSASIIIGPEGGFTEHEVSMAITEGIKPVSLGPRILRTETAGIAVISVIMYEIGDFGS